MRPSAVSSLAIASQAPLASSSTDTSAPTVATRDSTRLQPASEMRRDSNSSGDSRAGATAWISNWWPVAGRGLERFNVVTGLTVTGSQHSGVGGKCEGGLRLQLRCVPYDAAEQRIGGVRG